MPKWYTVYERGDKFAGHRMYIRLYPNVSSVDSNCTSGTTITNGLDTAMYELLDGEAISYYRIQRFNVDDYPYPDVDLSGDISAQFNDYLTDGSGNGNGTGSDLKDWVGAHTLVHEASNCTHLNSAYEDIEDSDQDCSDDSAFKTGRLAYTAACSNASLRKNSAIQEPFHVFIRWHQEDVKSMLGDFDGLLDKSRYDEHSLGRIQSDGDVTPMLTYHAGDWDGGDEGDCTNGSSNDTGFTPYPTSCTINAVDYITSDIC